MRLTRKSPDGHVKKDAWPAARWSTDPFEKAFLELRVELRRREVQHGLETEGADYLEELHAELTEILKPSAGAGSEDTNRTTGS